MSDFELWLRDGLAGAVPTLVGWLAWFALCLSAGFVGAFLLALRAADPSGRGFFKWWGILGGGAFCVGAVLVSLARLVGIAWSVGTMAG